MTSSQRSRAVNLHREETVVQRNHHPSVSMLPRTEHHPSLHRATESVNDNRPHPSARKTCHAHEAQARMRLSPQAQRAKPLRGHAPARRALPFQPVASASGRGLASNPRLQQTRFKTSEPFLGAYQVPRPSARQAALQDSSGRHDSIKVQLTDALCVYPLIPSR